jgi:hypothetical protein
VKPLWDKFWGKVEKSNNCWNWTGSKNEDGYGRFMFHGKNRSAHRISWLITFGFLPAKGVEVCHDCDNPACVRPSHLFEGTHSENMKDCWDKGRSRLVIPVGKNHWNAKLNEKNVSAIRQTQLTAKEAAALYGVSIETVYQIRSRRIWKHI